MSKVQNIQIQGPFTEGSNEVPSKYGLRKTSKLSFGANDVVEISKKIASSAKKNSMTKLMKVYDFLALNEGELEAQLITALFTSTLAPLVIAYNPVSNKPKKDKQYVAMRQPLSAVISLAGGVPATILLNNAFSKIASEGYFKDMDLRMAPNANYLNPKFKKDYNDAKTNGKLNDFINDLKVGEEVKTDRKFFDVFGKLYDKGKIKAAYTKREVDNLTEFYSQFISADKASVAFDNDTKEVVIKNIVPDKNCACNEIRRIIPRMNSLEDVQKYHEKMSIKEVKFREFLKEQLGFNFNGDGTLKAEQDIVKMRETLAKDFVEKLGIFDKIDPEKLDKLCAVARENKVHGDIKEVQKATSRQIQNKLGKDSAKSKVTMEQLLERFDIIDGSSENKIMQFQKLMSKPVNEIWSLFKGKFENVGEKFEVLKNDGEKSPKNTIDFARTYMKKIIETKTENFKNILKLNGIVVNLAVVIGTCSLLNWVYPRFMEKVFPSLCTSSDKVEKGGK